MLVERKKRYSKILSLFDSFITIPTALLLIVIFSDYVFGLLSFKSHHLGINIAALSVVAIYSACILGLCYENITRLHTDYLNYFRIFSRYLLVILELIAFVIMFQLLFKMNLLSKSFAIGINIVIGILFFLTFPVAVFLLICSFLSRLQVSKKK